MLYTLGCVCNQNDRDLSRHYQPLDVVADKSCRLSGSLEYGAWGEGSPPPLCASVWQIMGSGGWREEREGRGMGREGSESIFVSKITVKHTVHVAI